MISPEKAKAMAEKIVEERGGDTEGLHGALDDLLCLVLADAGYRGLVDVFLDADKWYA